MNRLERCRSCAEYLTDTRMVLARARTGDLVFCGYQGLRRWEDARVRRIERLHAEERFVGLASEAILRRHPHADWLVKHGHIGRVGLSDAALQAAVERLERWLSAQPERSTGTG